MSAKGDGEALFLKDVAEHKMEVLVDNGMYRHLKCRKPGTYCYGFDVHTWPGYLCITGDMGCYVFSRLPDMFEFFRTDQKCGGHLYINLGYWAEKVQAQCKTDGVEEYSEEKFREAIEYYLSEREDVTDELREAIKEEVLTHADSEHEAYAAVHEFSHGKFYFQDFFDHNLKDYTMRFVWCCYAIAWAIRQYDNSKDEKNEKML
jgi:hypothetical protein